MQNKKQETQQKLRSLPAVHKLIGHERMQMFAAQHGVSHELQVSAAQQTIEDWRARIQSGMDHLTVKQQLEDRVVDSVIMRLKKWLQPQLGKVINGTGIVLHTNLGRAVLSEAAIQQLQEVASSYCNLEYDIAAGERGSRHQHVEELICRLTGAEAAVVVNNNAAAVFLVLRELAQNKEVIVSRGQLVEIGGSFRISEIMAESGCRLIEVGTTNKTHIYDYERALTEETALLLKVHTSNFKTLGFTSEVSIKEMSELAMKKGIPLYEDLGSGVLYDLRSHGIGDEPVVSEVLKAGADLVSFSGDKLLGGPQAGIIAGKKQWIERLKQNQLMRILRLDKLNLAALEAVLRQYLMPARAVQEIPTLKALTLPLSEIRVKAERFAAKVDMLPLLDVRLTEDSSEAGGGTLPGVSLPTVVASIHIDGISAQHLAQKLRGQTPPIITRIAADVVKIDFRTILEDDLDELVAAFRHINGEHREA